MIGIWIAGVAVALVLHFYMIPLTYRWARFPYHAGDGAAAIVLSLPIVGWAIAISELYDAVLGDHCDPHELDPLRAGFWFIYWPWVGIRTAFRWVSRALTRHFNSIVNS